MALTTKPFAASKGSEMALADETTLRTWSELDARVNQLVHALQGAGLKPGDTAAIVSGNRVEWFELTLACAHSGVIFVPVNWHLVAPEMAYIFGDSGAKAVFAGERYIDIVAEALTDERCSNVELKVAIGDGGDHGMVPFEEFVATGSADEPETQVLGGPMFYTSGTTGNPKGVRSGLSFMGPETSPEMWLLVGGGFTEPLPTEGTTVLCGPCYHSAQWAYSFIPLLVGSSVVMQHKYDSTGLLELIDTHRCTNVHLVPTQMKRLMDLPDDVKASYDGSSMEYVIHGAAPCPPAVKRSLIDWWGPKISEYYGSTEGSIISIVSSEEWLERGGSVGKPQPTIEIMVVGENGEHLGPNESGTLYFRNLMGMDFEYHNAPEKTADAHLEPGVFTTGDVGYLDDDGYLWLSDRKIDMIISGGVNIYPAEIEGALGGHPDVADVAVIGVPNDEFGEEVKAIVVPTSGVGDDDLRAVLGEFCRTNLAGYKVPRSFDFLDALPRTGTGKVQKRKLRDPYWEGIDRSI